MAKNRLSESVSTSTSVPNTEKSKSVYFPNLNGVRFIAAFSVLVHHIEQAKAAFGLPNLYSNHIIKHAGKQGVGLFFVLSGFLITYLLLSEKSKNNSINIKNFYVRRVLRIWPIYYIIVLLGTLVLPHFKLFYWQSAAEVLSNAEAFWPRLSLLMMILPNLSFIFYELPYLCSQTWSIGVEEQFYYLWPWLIRANSWKARLGIIAIFILGTAAIFLMYFFFFTNNTIRDLPQYVIFFFSQFRILMMVMGGIGAYLVFTKHSILAFLFQRKVQFVVYGILLTIIISGYEFKGINLELLSVFFCYFIVNVAVNPQSIINLEQSVVSYLGKISYGLYIYHIAINVAIMNFLRPYQQTWSLGMYNLVMYGLTIGLTVAIASLSFHFLEQKLLAFKVKFSH